MNLRRLPGISIYNLSNKKIAMRHALISGDQHSALLYYPPDLWSVQAPTERELLLLYTRERWLIDYKMTVEEHNLWE